MVGSRLHQDNRAGRWYAAQPGASDGWSRDRNWFIDHSGKGVVVETEAIGNHGRWIARRSTSWLRQRPSFLIIGGIRCGTTSLIRYLGEHPSVEIPSVKEVHYFDLNFDRSEGWYRSWFPPESSALRRDVTGGESSPGYLMDPCVPQRVARMLPDVRLILLVRDPVERAHSHYRLRRARGDEPSPTFAEALADEPRRMEISEAAKGRSGLRHDCYFHQGNYAEGFERWLNHFSMDQIITLRSEDLFRNPPAIYNETLRFLDLPSHGLGEYVVHNAARSSEMDPDVREVLTERYRTPNETFLRLTDVALA